MTSPDFGAEIREWADFALFRGGQATRRDTGIPRLVMMLMTLQATLASVFCVGRVKAATDHLLVPKHRDLHSRTLERLKTKAC
jgi:hypothetical protein